MTRDPVREALVSARHAAFWDFIGAPDEPVAELQALHAQLMQAANAVAEYDRTPHAAPSDAGATLPTPEAPRV